MQTVSRRGFLVLGGTGAAGAVLAACGSTEDRRAEGDDAALLAAALTAETALEAAYAERRFSASGAPSAAVRSALDAFRAASARRVEELAGLVEDAGGEPAGTEAGAADAIEGANAAIAAYREAAGPLPSEESRSTMIAFLTAVAAELAVMSDFAGDDPAPSAFVTGGSEEPFEPTADSETTTSTTSTAEESP